MSPNLRRGSERDLHGLETGDHAAFGVADRLGLLGMETEDLTVAQTLARLERVGSNRVEEFLDHLGLFGGRTDLELVVTEEAHAHGEGDEVGLVGPGDGEGDEVEERKFAALHDARVPMELEAMCA